MTNPRATLAGTARLLMAFSFLACVSGVTGAPPADVDWPAFLAQHDLVWEQLPPSWNTGGFTGNGQLGMMIHERAEQNCVDFHLGRSDVTDHRKAPDLKTSFGVPGANLQLDYPRLDIGELVLRPAGKILGGTMRLDLWNAEVTAKVETDLGEVTFRAFTHHGEMVNVIDVTSTERTPDGRAAAWKWEFMPAKAIAPRRITNPEEASGSGYAPNPPPEISEVDGVHLCVQPLLAGGDYATAWQVSSDGRGHGTLFISTANEVPQAGESARVARKTVRDAASQKPGVLAASHREWWHAFYPQSFLSIPDGRLESFYWIQLYKFASASRAGGPLIDCLGPFFRVTQWPGAWWNLNVQLTYWIPLASNHLELGQPLVDQLDRSFDQMLAGACHGPGIGDFAWVLHNYWLQYRYAGDEGALRAKWAPKAAKLAACYIQRLIKEDDGKLHLPQTQSPEYPGPPGTKGFGRFDDSNYNLALLRWLLSSLLEVSGGDAPQAPVWKQTLADLTPLVTGPDGLMIGRDQPVAISHRHYSHLLALYPLFQLNPDDPGDRDLVDRSVTHWHHLDGGKLLRGYSFTGAASLYAALGRGDDALAMLQKFLQNDGGGAYISQNTFYFETAGRNPVIETPLSGAAAVSQMLLQSWGGKLRVFPAMPNTWAEASFSNLRGEGGFLVSARRVNGGTAWASVTSLAGQPCRIKIPGWSGVPFVKSARAVEAKAVAAGEYELDLQAGESAVLLPAAESPQPPITAISHPVDEWNSYGVKRADKIPSGQFWPE